MNQSDFARLHGVSRKTITIWKSKGWVIFSGEDNDAIDKVFFSEGWPGVKPAVDTPPVEIDLSSIELAIANVPGTKGFLLMAPTENITLDVGQLPVRGAVTYT
ncbi:MULTISPECIES: hypothetical protein [unclassified Serratia (in: enterobacteria)]|uniref:hypothetical protein n=1 Tax=unclassified Serratia (in: enterobacteria) TaxID=2647522 RepID=UPI003B435DDB